jgi:hypothetical protein
VFVDALRCPGRVFSPDNDRVALAVEAESMGAVSATLGRDPWSQTHLLMDAIDPWTIRLDGRRT